MRRFTMRRKTKRGTEFGKRESKSDVIAKSDEEISGLRKLREKEREMLQRETAQRRQRRKRELASWSELESARKEREAEGERERERESYKRTGAGAEPFETSNCWALG